MQTSLFAQVITVNKKSLINLTVLKSSDIIFRQFEQQVQQGSINMRGRREIEHIFYTYTVTKEYADLLSLSARLNIPQETLVTLNRLPSREAVIKDKTLLIPVNKGFYIPHNPQSSYELLLYKNYQKDFENSLVYSIDGTKYYFLPDKAPSPTERAFLLDSSFRPPLSSSTLTSSYGYRVSPISGDWKFHSGLDLASPEGSPVFSCKNGKVTKADYNDTYGNFIIILHDNKMTSTYAHLSEILVKSGEIVSAGQTIGKVGSTGASTGPHLHFEIRFSGSPTDPGKLINIKK